MGEHNKEIARSEKEERRDFKKLSAKEQSKKASRIRGAVDVLCMFSYKMEENKLNRYLYPFYYEVVHIIEDYKKNIDLYMKQEIFVISQAIRTIENSRKQFDMNDIMY